MCVFGDGVCVLMMCVGDVLMVVVADKEITKRERERGEKE